MKVLMLNGSSHINGTTFTALNEIGKALNNEGIDYEIFQIGADAVRDCIGCNQCTPDGCAYTKDNVNEFIAKAKEADAFVFGTPVYYAHPSGRILSFLDRVASFDVLNKYYGISQMPVVSSTYWNNVYGRNENEAVMDLEGLQTMRNVAHNMAWMLKCIEAGKNAGVALPATEREAKTNFIK